MTIGHLIDKVDTFELVRDKIAQILVDEVASQMQLATDAGKDSQRWKLRVFAERFNPIELVLNTTSDLTPVVNVSYDTSSFPQAAGNAVERQLSQSIYNIDCYGFGLSEGEVGGGHTPGDLTAALEAQRCIMLVRNILMAAEYTYLGLRGLVGRRWPQSIVMTQPKLEGRQIQLRVWGRLVLGVQFNEFSPQVAGNPLELAFVDINRAADGQLIAQAAYDYTT